MQFFQKSTCRCKCFFYEISSRDAQIILRFFCNQKRPLRDKSSVLVLAKIRICTKQKPEKAFRLIHGKTKIEL